MKVLVLLFFIIPVISLGKSIFCNFNDNELTDRCRGISKYWKNPGDNPMMDQFRIDSAFADTIHIESAKAYDLVINEILADPSPPVLLPEIEYIEIFNGSAEDIYIKGWHLTINKYVTELPDEIIRSGEYALIIDAEDMFSYNIDIHKIACDKFPALNNKAAEIILQDSLGSLMHAVRYSDDLYETSSKKDGGWSLEMINPNDPCAKFYNWQESIDYRGGTPGEENSIFQSSAVSSIPELWRAAVTERSSLMLYFSEPLDSIRSISPEFFTVNHGIGVPDSIIPAWPILDRLELFFSTAFKENQIYEIFLSSDLCDCSGQSLIYSGNFQFSVPEWGDNTGIIINEVMFDPEYGFTEYIELYNQSDNTIDLRNFNLIIGGTDEDTLIITQEYFPVYANEYIIIAEHYKGIDNSEIFSKAERIVYMENMPFLTNNGSEIYILNAEKQICDLAFYSPAYHHSILTDTKGVALERISPGESGFDPDNWHSASSGSGYQTPAAENSQNEIANPSFRIEISPTTITPNGDGVDDELIISYKMDAPGYMARIIIFDKIGRKVHALANGDLLATEGDYFFKGTDNTGNSLPSGYYIVFFDAYNDKGNRHKEKKSFVVAGY